MSDGSSHYESVMFDVETAVKEAVRGFAKWHAGDAQMTREQWLKWFQEPPPEGDYFTGYNAGVESVLLGVAIFLDEIGP